MKYLAFSLFLFLFLCGFLTSLLISCLTGMELNAFNVLISTMSVALICCILLIIKKKRL